GAGRRAGYGHVGRACLACGIGRGRAGGDAGWRAGFALGIGSGTRVGCACFDVGFGTCLRSDARVCLGTARIDACRCHANCTNVGIGRACPGSLGTGPRERCSGIG
ncbi:hypothetical protein, partial [Burkholderia diffusa]|uniref:hypothetical protein n=1 Tax=Burkholderia diffusa TaxID=488732 RepID=UPI0014792800